MRRNATSGGAASWRIGLLIAAALATRAARADAPLGRKLAHDRRCLTCHGVRKKIIGPAFRAIAARYRGVAGAEALLARRVRAGSAGVWGKTPMPANPQASDAEIRVIVRWMLAL